MAKTARQPVIDDGTDEDGEDPGNTIQTTLARPVDPAIRMPKTAKQEDETNFTAIEVDDDGKELGSVDVGDEVEDKGKKAPKKRTEADADEADEDDNEGNLAEDEDGETAEDGRRWPTTREKRRRRKEARDRNIRENETLKRQLEATQRQLDEFRGRVEPKLTEIDESRVRGQINAVENQLQTAEGNFSKAESDVVKALREGDEEAILKAMRTRDQAFIGVERLKSQKDQLARLVGKETNGEGADNGQRREVQGRQRVDPDVQRHVSAFRREFPWFNGDNVEDEDSQLVKHLDNRVRNAGFDPKTQDYWDELKDRMSKAKDLAHRFASEEGDEDEDEDTTRRQPQNRKTVNGNGGKKEERKAAPQRERRGPMTSGSSEGRSAGRVGVKITPERKRALIESGTLDANGTVLDPVKFRAQLKSYDQFDRANGLSQ